jgi:tetratricopeptide (TPR) repeat protein
MSDIDAAMVPPRFTFVRFALVLLCALSASGPTGLAGEPEVKFEKIRFIAVRRQWHDISGGLVAEASFVKASGGKIELLTSNWGTIKVAASRLSEDDRAYLSKLLTHSAGVCFETDQFDDAFHDADEAINIDPKNAMAYAFRGLARSHRGEADKAIADCNEAVRLEPKSAVVYGLRAAMWEEQNELDKALADCDEALRLDQTAFHAFLTRGIIWHRKGDLEQAVADFGQAIKLTPDDPQVYTTRALALIMNRNGEKALEDANEAIRLAPKRDIGYRSRSFA